MYDCLLHHFITSQYILKCAPLTFFPQPPTSWLKFEKETYGPFDSPPMDSYLLPINTCGLSLTVFLELLSPTVVFCYVAGSKSISTRPLVRPSDPNTMTNTAVEANASSSGNNDELFSPRLFTGGDNAHGDNVQTFLRAETH